MRFPTMLATAGLLVSIAACGGGHSHDSAPESAPAEESVASPAPANTSETVVDTTGTFFDDTTGTVEGAHEHGPDTHTH